MPPRFLGSIKAALMSDMSNSSCSFLMLSTSTFTEMYTPLAGSNTSLKYKQMSPNVRRSILPLTIRALTSLCSSTSAHLMIGVEMDLEALMISLILGTPKVTFMLATPAKWNVFKVICVAGSAIDCAATAPTASPGIRMACTYFTAHRFTKASSCHCVGQPVASARSRASPVVASTLAFPAESAVSPGCRQSRRRVCATFAARPRMNPATVSRAWEMSSSAPPCVRLTKAAKRSAHGPASSLSSTGSNGQAW
mmetsp:Transcript_57863/g.162289  ORF Transcript_57863/g.162289 Transcript_57863/m.162289 type:complete len:252 (-) Transcript_57863:250-1005(-)